MTMSNSKYAHELIDGTVSGINILDPVKQIESLVIQGVTYEVKADLAETCGDLVTMRAYARDAGWAYEKVGNAYMSVSLVKAAEWLRQAERAYRRGRSVGRAVRMELRAERCDRGEA